jgi:hypothetical protein
MPESSVTEFESLKGAERPFLAFAYRKSQRSVFARLRTFSSGTGPSLGSTKTLCKYIRISHMKLLLPPLKLVQTGSSASSFLLFGKRTVG